MININAGYLRNRYPSLIIVYLWLYLRLSKQLFDG